MHCGTQSKWQPLGQPVLYCFWFLWISRHDLFFFNVYLAVYVVYKTTGSRSKDRIYSKPEGQSTLTYSFLLFSHLLVLFARTEHSVSDRNACVSDLLVKGSFSYGLGSWKNGLACWTVAEFVFCSLLAFFFFHWLMVVCFSTLANPVGFLTCWLLMWFAGTRCTAPVAAVRSGWQSMDWCSMIMILMWRTAPRNRRRYWLMHDIQHSKGFFFRSVQYFALDFTDFYAKQFWSCLPEAFDLTVLCFMHTGRSHKECLFRSSFWKTHIIWDGLHSSFLFETYLLNWIVLVNQWGEWGDAKMAVKLWADHPTLAMYPYLFQAIKVAN